MPELRRGVLTGQIDGLFTTAVGARLPATALTRFCCGMAAGFRHIRYRVACAPGSGPYGRPTLVSAKVGKAIAPGWAASRFPHSGAAPPGRAEGPSMAHRRWLGIHASLPGSASPAFGLRQRRDWRRL
jgi:hypothetical protein